MYGQRIGNTQTQLRYRVEFNLGFRERRRLRIVMEKFDG